MAQRRALIGTAGAAEPTEELVMAIEMIPATQAGDVACDESQERVILPMLAEWRVQESGSGPHPPAHHRGAERAAQIPRQYALMPAEELDARIAGARAALGERLVILGHHYQREEIINWADVRGDSFKLAQYAGTRPQPDYILFCGVHFMAESADILSGPPQQGILPNPAAGGSMADIANICEAQECWAEPKER